MPDSSPRTCPKCATAIPASFPEGLCPKCLLEQAAPEARVLEGSELQTQSALDDSERTLPVPPPVSGSLPVRQMGVPSLETLRGLFPELEILDVLGAGGMGAVYKARQPRLNRLVALKIMVAAPGHETDFALRFEREAQVLARLNHPHIVILYDFGELGPERTGADPLFYFLMEHVDGTDLGQIIKSKELTPAQALAIVPQICEALQYAHDQGITHRDIKPANILIDKRGVVKIADFGLAKVVGGAEEALMTGLTQTGTAMGTPHYMAPEQWEHPQQVDHRADIYALGVVFYEMLTGERPAGVFEPPSKKSKSPVDKKLDGVVMRAMDKDPERRYQQAGQIRDDVTRISGANKSRQASGESREKSRLLHPFISLGTAATLGVGAWMLWPEKGENPGREAGSPAAAVPPPTALGGPSALPSKPGRLRAVGVMLNGQPHDLSKFAAYDDFVDVAGGRDRWVALRANGETVSSDGQSDLKNIRRIVRAVSVSDVYAFITTAGKILFREGSPHELPDELKKAVVVDAVLGSEHGLALTDAGVVVTFGTRYQETHGDPADSQRWGTPRWPQPPVQALRKVKTVAATTTHAASLHEDGTVSVWGWEGLVRWDTDPRQKAIREIASSQDGLWMLDAAGLVWQLPLPRNPSPQQPVSGAGKVRLMDEVRATRIGERCWLRVTGEWCQEASVCRWIFQQNLLRRDTVFSLRTSGFSQNGQASLLWIEPKPNVVSTIAAAPGRAVGLPAAAAPPQTAQGWQDLLSETSALQLSGGSTVTNGKLTLPSRSGIAVAAASNLGEKPQDGAVRMIVTFIQGKPQPSLIARQSPQNARYSALVRQGDRVLLQRVSEDNEEIEVGSYPLPAPLRDGETYELELRALGTHLSVWLKGVELGGIEDASVSRGWFGVRQFGDAEVTVDDLAFLSLGPCSAADTSTPAKPGRLHAIGTMLNGRPPDLAKSSAFDDFVDVAGSYENWVALRANGDTLSSDGKADFQGIRRIARSYQGGYPCFIDMAGGLRFHPLREMVLPSRLKGRVIVDAACGSHHGVALLEDGQAVVFGRRYEEAMEDSTQVQGVGTPRWPQPDPAALQNVKGVAVTQTHAATLHHDGSVSVWGWEGAVKWQPEPEMKPVRQIASFHDALHLLDEAGQVWSFALPRSVHPDQPVGFNGRVKRLAGAAARLRDHFWLRQDGAWGGVEADRPTMEMLESARLRPETNFALLASIAGAKPFGYVLWIEPVVEAKTTRAATKDTPFVNSLGMKFVPVPITGGPTDGQRVLFSIWETRLQDFQTFSRETKLSFGSERFAVGPDPTHPVATVTWDEAQAFCSWLTERERKDGKLGAGERYRLPSDHEWSCAVGIGEREDVVLSPKEKSGKLLDVHPWGTAWPPSERSGNFASEELRPLLAEARYDYIKSVIPSYQDGHATLAPVGSYPANALGLFDLAGNVFEWCEDWFDSRHEERVYRGGGSWSSFDRREMMSAKRGAMGPLGKVSATGFRVVLASPEPGGPGALPTVKPGRLRASGTTANGKPHDLTKFAAHDDFVDVAGGWGRWVALRANGQTISSDGRADFTGIAKIAASFNSEYALISTTGKLVIPDYEVWTLPAELEQDVVDAALGMQHGIALLEGGRAVVFGARYEGVVGDPGDPKQYGTPRWPAPEARALEKVRAVAATVTHAATLHEDGSLSLWGWEGPLEWHADPRQQKLRLLRSTEDGFWALDEAGQLWHLPVPRNPAPGQPVHITGKPSLSGAGVTHLRPRCWRRKSGEWAAHLSIKEGMEMMKEAAITENSAFSLSGGLFDGKPFASLLWIESK